MDAIKEAYQRKDRIKTELRAEAREKIRFEASLDFVTKRQKIEQDFKDEKNRLKAEQLLDDEEHAARKRERELKDAKIITLRDKSCAQLLREEESAAQTSIKKAEDTWAAQDEEDDQNFLAWLKGVPLTDHQTVGKVSSNDLALNSTPNSTPNAQNASMNQDLAAVPDDFSDTNHISADSDDEPIFIRRGYLRDSSSEKSSPASGLTPRRITPYEIESEDFIVEMPKSSRNYYIMRCPHCPDKRFGAHGPYFHFNNKYKMHGHKLSTENVLEICGWKVKGATTTWIEKHNSSFTPLRNTKKMKDEPTQSTDFTSTLFDQNPKLRQEGKVKQEIQVLDQKKRHLPTVQSSYFKLGPDNIYCSPTCLKGVPYEEIDESSPYWELDWNTWTDWMNDKEMKTLAETISRKRASKSNHSSLKDLEREYRRLSKDMEFRQEVQNYFKELRWHPNQLLNKTYVQGTGILAGRTVEALYRILKSLEKVTLDLEPVDWLRRRLSTLISECEKQGSKFSIKTALKGFNNDPQYIKIKAEIESENIQANTAESSKRVLASHEPHNSANNFSEFLKTPGLNISVMNGSIEQCVSQDEKIAGVSSDKHTKIPEKSVSNEEVSNNAEDTRKRIRPSDTSSTEANPTKIQKIGFVNDMLNVDSSHAHAHPQNTQKAATEYIIPPAGPTLIGGRQKEIQKSIAELGLSTDMNPSLIGGRLPNIQKLFANLGPSSSVTSASINKQANEVQKSSTTSNVSQDVNESGKRAQLVESDNRPRKIQKVHDDPSTPSFQPSMKRAESEKRVVFQLEPLRQPSAPVFSSSAESITTTVKTNHDASSSPNRLSPTVRNETPQAKHSTVICLTRLSCGPKLFPQGNKRSYKLNSETGYWEPFLNDNPIMMFEENLVINRSDVISLAFHTESIQGDTVILMKKAQNIGDPSFRIACTFNSADVADQFASSLWRPRRPHEKALIISKDDESRILQYRHTSMNAAKPAVQPESHPYFSPYGTLVSPAEEVSVDDKAFQLFCHERRGTWQSTDQVNLAKVQRAQWADLGTEARSYFQRKASPTIASGTSE